MLALLKEDQNIYSPPPPLPLAAFPDRRKKYQTRPVTAFGAPKHLFVEEKALRPNGRTDGQTLFLP